MACVLALALEPGAPARTPGTCRDRDMRPEPNFPGFWSTGERARYLLKSNSECRLLSARPSRNAGNAIGSKRFEAESSTRWVTRLPDGGSRGFFS